MKAKELLETLNKLIYENFEDIYPSDITVLKNQLIQVKLYLIEEAKIMGGEKLD